jgi:C1A family cysteine protease
MHFRRKGILIFSLFLLATAIFPISTSKANETKFNSRFDWREQGYDFPVQDQGDCNAGYAFAGVEAVQAAIWKKEGVKVDLSENNAIRCNWYALTDTGTHSCKGGDFRMVINQFTQDGLVQESCDPFDAMNLTCNQSCDTVYYVTEWQHISQFQRVASVDEIKGLLENHGPIYSEMDVNIPGFEYFKGGSVIYFEDPDVSDNTHAVLIVGWDDELQHSHGKGAWIVKNSYGTDWGDNGYFYVAYGSAGIGNDIAVVTGYSKSSPGNKVYFYDEAGHNNPIILDNNDYFSGSALGIFSIDSDEYTRSVEFWTNDKAIINLRIFSQFENEILEDLIYERLNFQTPFAGYYNISLPYFEMKSGDEIIVELEVTNEKNFFPIMTDDFGPPSDNRTWYKDKDGVWQSFHPLNRDAAIRLRTSEITEDFSRVFLPILWK